jgi:hypothetical protein
MILRLTPTSRGIVDSPSRLDTWSVQLKSSRTGSTPLDRIAELESAIHFADSFVSSQRPDSERLVSRDARWRDGVPTDRQVGVLERNGIPVPPELPGSTNDPLHRCVIFSEPQS